MNEIVPVGNRTVTEKAASAILNSVRRLTEMFPGYFGQTKHNYAKDFGWPDNVSFQMLFNMYKRNGLAKAAVHKTASKTWEDFPKLAADAIDTNTQKEEAVIKHFRKLNFWQKMAEADRRAMVGHYSGLILRVSDGLRFEDPLNPAKTIGITSLVEVIPAWSSQLTVSQWDHDIKSETYGQPLMFQFNEADVIENRREHPKARSFMVHPSRVMVWSTDGTVFGRSLLEAGYNDLIDMEKIKGAGGEGFWKNAKAAPVLEIDKDASLRDMAMAMGVEPDGILEAMNKQVDSYAKGFDQLLMVQGIQVKPMNVQLSVPESFFMTALMSFAASVEMPLKILVGTQSGERASSEDAKEWSQTINARRVNHVLPLINALVDKLIEGGFLVGDWAVSWSDLTKATVSDKLELAMKMASINQKTDILKTGELVFTKEELRQAVDFPSVPVATAALPDDGLGETQKTEVDDAPKPAPSAD